MLSSIKNEKLLKKQKKRPTNTFIPSYPELLDLIRSIEDNCQRTISRIEEESKIEFENTLNAWNQEREALYQLQSNEFIRQNMEDKTRNNTATAATNTVTTASTMTTATTTTVAVQENDDSDLRYSEDLELHLAGTIRNTQALLSIMDLSSLCTGESPYRTILHDIQHTMRSTQDWLRASQKQRRK